MTGGGEGEGGSAERQITNPTNVASVHLVMGCPNDRARFKRVKKKIINKSNLEIISTSSLIATSGVAVGVALVVPILVG